MPQASKMTKPDIILITVDSLRPDHLSGRGYPRETSPNIDHLAKTGRSYQMAFSLGGATEEAFPSLLAGVPPPLNFKESQMGIRRGTSLAITLKGSGYSTAAFNSNPYLSDYFGYSSGFDVFSNDLRAELGRAGTMTGSGIGAYLKAILFGTPPIVRGEVLSRQLLDWTRDVQRPFFAWIHFMDTHMPYLPPSESARRIGVKPPNRLYMQWLYRKMWESNKVMRSSMGSAQSLLSPREISDITTYYDSAVRYVDTCVGEIVKGLEEQGKLGKTLLVLTADHGELLGEHGIVDHGYLYDQVIHVPLIVGGSDVSHEVITVPVTHYAVRDTILDYAAGGDLHRDQAEKMYADFGKGIIGSVIYDDKVSSISCRTNEWKYIETIRAEKGSSTRHVELYDLMNDSQEENNTAEKNATQVHSFHKKIESLLSHDTNVRGSMTHQTLSPEDERELQRRLNALGYT